MQRCAHRRQNFLMPRQPASPHHPASQIAFIGLYNIYAVFPQLPNIFLRRRMIPHIHVHRRSHHHRRRRRQIQSTQKIIRNSARELSNNVGSCRSHQQQVGTLRHRNVLDGALQVCFVLSIAKQVSNYFLPAQSRKSQRRNKFPRRTRHHHFHGKSILLQQAHQFRGLVSRDSPGHTHRDSHGVPGSAALLTALFAVLVLVDRIRFHEIVLEQTMIELFHRDSRCFLRSRIFHQRRCAGHNLPRAPRRQHHIRKLALRSFCQYRHLSHSPPNDARSFSTRSWRRTLVQRSAVTIACTSRPARSTSSFTTQ